MKRRRDNDEDTANKRRRKNLASDIFDDESLSNCLCNVSGVNSAIGYFTGSVSMRWLPGGKKFIFQITSRCCVTLNRAHKINVTFEGDWIEPMHARWGLLSIMENIQLSLDGVTSVYPQTSKQTAKLVYTDGVMYRRVREGKETETCFINSWQLQEEQREQEDLDWFATPTVPLNGPLSEFVRTASAAGLKSVPSPRENQTSEKRDDDSSLSKENLPPVDEHPTKQQEVVSTATPRVPSQPASISKANTVANVQQTTNENTHENQSRPPLPPLSRKQEKKAKKKLARAEKAQREALAQLAISSVAANTAISTSSSQMQVGNPPPTRVDANAQVVKLGELLPVEDNPGGWMARLQRFKGNYKMLKDATDDKKSINIVGVVRSFKPPRLSTKNDWTSNVYLQDPSLFPDGEQYTTRDYTVNFFQRRFKEWLPQVKIGDILVLHDIKVQNHSGNPFGVGYYDRAKWAVYSIKDECFVPPKLDQAPKEQELVDGGFKFTPFLRASEPEERYCQQLSAWWKEKNKDSAESTGQVYSLSESAIPGRTRRQHLLLCDAGPDVEPGGYFDCAFEVINAYQTKDYAPTLYVTDYTKNTIVAPCQAKWCPPGLNDCIVKFELWDGAAGLAPSLVPGTYWSVRNARLRRGHDGYVEGKIVEKKFSKLEPDSEYAPLQELLKRKKEWEAANKSKQTRFEHKLLKDVGDGDYANCTVELLHTSKGYDEAYLEVTDYTAHPKMSSYRYEKDWSRDLEGLIASIHLRDAQVQHAKTLRPGLFLNIKNLRLKDNHVQKRFQGDLGGHDVLVHRLDIHHPNDDLKALLERKKVWLNTKDAKLITQEQRKTNHRVSDLAKRPNLTIKELESNPKKKLKVRVIARVVAYHPVLSEWIHAWCSKCKQRIPDDKRACHNCQDMDHEFVRWKFRLLLRVEDRNGDAMDVVLGDQSDFLQGLEIGDCFHHTSILTDISKRLEPLLGDSKVNQREKAGQDLDNDYVGLIIARHENSGIGPMYILLDVET